MSLLINTDFFWNPTIWNPSMITTALWLDAADAATVTADGSNLISNVNDKSGNNRSFTASAGARPTYSASTLNSKAVFTFGGSQWLTSANAASTWNFLHQDGGAEIIGAWKAGNTSDPNTVYGFWGTNAGTVSNRGIYQRWDDRSVFSYNNALIIASESATSTIVDISANNVHDANAATILGLTQDFSNATAANKARHVVNGTVLAGTNTGATVGFSGNAAFTLQIGAVGNNVWPLTGYIAEFLAFNSKLSTDTRQRIEGYLAHKWGLTANLPAGHPYKTVGPRP